ncbi:hypothetical protein [Burkholderia phage vB_BpP_HN03]|uniref:Uncharacterized protein n=1 Tax=Burkholderia phage vB_BpP_HN02 TaxID=3116925 RepID=A0AAX4JHQ0_9CAUD
MISNTSGMLLLRWMGKEGGYELHDHAYHFTSDDVDMYYDAIYDAVVEHLNSVKPVLAIDDVLRIVFIGVYSLVGDGEDVNEFFDIEAIHYRKMDMDELNRFYEQLEIDEDLREQERAEEDAS